MEVEPAAAAVDPEEQRRQEALTKYKKALVSHKEVDSGVKAARMKVKELSEEYEKSEDDLKALQSVGQIIGEVLRQLDPAAGTPSRRAVTVRVR